MVLTTLLLAHTMLKNWRWSLATTILVAGVFLVVDVGFFVANLTKIAEGRLGASDPRRDHLCRHD